MKVLMTGVTGFVGSHLESALLSENCTVSAIVRSKPEGLALETKLYQVNDLITADFMSLVRGYDVVVHLAALVHQPKQNDVQQYMQLNCDVTVSLGEACVKNKISKFITLSTSHVYEGCGSDFVEHESLCPQSPYAQSKYQATRALEALFSGSKTSWYVIRPPLIYGDGVKGNLRSLASLITKIPLVPFKCATAPRSYVSIKNVCDFILFLVQNNVISGVYNVSDNNDLSTQDLCSLIAKAQGKKIIQLPVPRGIMKVFFTMLGRADNYDKIYSRFCLNISKARAAGCEPRRISYKDFML